jgi:Fe-S-cluster containining protein
MWILKFDYPKHVRFKCDRCALCCGDTEERIRQILLLKTEANLIAEGTSISIDEFAEEIEGSDPFVYRMRKNGRRCVFLRDSLCSIYDRRPIICRFYPFKLENLGRNHYVFSYTDECPSIGKGAPLRKSFFEELFKEFLKSMGANQRSE